MNKSYQYKVTEALQTKAAKEMFLTVYVGKNWIVIGMLIFVSLYSLSTYSLHTQFKYFIIPATILFISIWITSYYKLISNSKTYLETINGDNTQTLELTDEGMNIKLSNNSRNIHWSKIDKILESKSFFIFLYKKLPLICIPKEILKNDINEVLQIMENPNH